MILSASRRTDIPNYYSDWFFNRLQEGFLFVRNPYNPHQISRIDLSPETVDCIVFWTKNPEPILGRLEELEGYPYYFQFTLTGYGKDIEPNVPHKKEKMLSVFRELSGRIGSRRVIWRYDPILFTKKYSTDYHLRAFEQIAGALKGYTHKCVISFVDFYSCSQNRMKAIEACEIPEEERMKFAGELVRIAAGNGMQVAGCAEKTDLTGVGIVPNRCIDPVLIEEILGCKIQVPKDKNQRDVCGCVESVEIGTYDTCQNGCLYCYASHSRERLLQNIRCYDPCSPLLCGKVTEEDRVSVRKVSSIRETQFSLTFSKNI